LLDPQSGHIELDGVDIAQISRDFLRQRCFVTVSQDSFLLHDETLRFNLDPEDALDDHTIINILHRAHLWTHFLQVAKEDDDRDILSLPLSKFPTLSAGQNQLLTLSRGVLKAVALRAEGALLVVLLDEVTSALDAETEAVVHGLVDSEFSANGHTVIVVPHRLGKLVEFARPGRDVVIRMRDGRLDGVVRDLRGLEGREEFD
jgi:ABC-type multidrug transport system fused ATPase/permease subunit